MEDNIITTVASFNDNNEALDSNGSRIVICKNGTYYVLKPSQVLGEGDRIVAVVTQTVDV